MSKPARVESRALAIWLILIGKAQSRQTMTYRMLDEMLKGRRVGPRNLKWHLAPVMAYCYANKLPNLTTIVVNERTGIPGPGLDIVRNRKVKPEKRGEAFAREREK